MGISIFLKHILTFCFKKIELALNWHFKNTTVRIVMKKLQWISIIFVFAQLSAFAQKNQFGYDISFHIEGLQDTTTYLGYYYGESTYLKDTAKVDNNGNFRFRATEKLPHGVYFLALNNVRLFDILVGEDQNFSITTDTLDYVKNIKVSNSLENEAFYSHMIFMFERNSEIQPQLDIVRDTTISSEKKKPAFEKIKDINEKVKAYQDAFIRENPKSLFSKILLSDREIAVPKAPVLANGVVDSTFAFRYFKKHYWDNFDLAGDALLRQPQPIYSKKIGDYLDRLFIQDSDTLIGAVDYLIAAAKPNDETYKYMVWNLVIKYQYPKIMGLDRVFVHLYDKYFETGEMDYWANDKLKENLKERAGQLRNSLIGMIAPNLIIQDLAGKPQSLYDIKNKYTVIYIYDPDCGHCKKETPLLKNFSDSTVFDVNIYAISADTSLVKMENYIDEMGMQQWVNVNGPRTYSTLYRLLYDADTTPTIYILDEKKKIIAKKISAERIEVFLGNYEKSLIEKKE